MAISMFNRTVHGNATLIYGDLMTCAWHCHDISRRHVNTIGFHGMFRTYHGNYVMAYGNAMATHTG